MIEGWEGYPEVVPDIFGTWCQHGAHICTFQGLRDFMGYPVEQPVDPWPCGQCTREDWDREREIEEEEYYSALMNEYYSHLSCTDTNYWE